MTWAPFLTCARAISAAASKSPSAIRRLNLRLPSTLVRSPTSTGRLSTSTSSRSMPETSVLAWIAGRRGLRPAAAAASARMWAGVVPQQPPDDVDPALVHEPRQLSRDRLRRLRVLPVDVGQPRVRVAGRQRLGDSRQRADVVGHELGARRAVEADGEKRRVHHRGVQGFDTLPGEHRAHRLDRDRDHHGRAPADLGEGLLDADQPRLEVARVLRRLEQQNVGPARKQADCLRAVVDDHLVECHAAGDGHGLRRRAHRARDEAQPPGSRRRGGGLASDLRRAPVDLDGLLRQPVLRQHERRATEGVRLDHVGAGGEVLRVHPPDDVRTRQNQVLVAALEIRPAEVLGREVLRLHPGAGRPVEHEDLLGQELLESLGALPLGRAGQSGNVRHEGRIMRYPGVGFRS